MLKTKEIHIRDPFVLTANGIYYLYGSRGNEALGICTGLDVYTGNDLENWQGSFTVFSPAADFWANMHFWAPEVHQYNGAYYMLVSFKSETRRRGTQILKSDSPMGPFAPITEYPVTPEDWECLDGTLYIDKEGNPHMVFCHEWTQIGNGEMCAMPLSPDLTRAIGEPKVLFKAGDLPWRKTLTEGQDHYVTDGPFLYTASDGNLLMLWSSFSENGYVEALAEAENGDLYGTWKHSEALFSESNGGHGMLFRNRNNRLTFVMHTPNDPPCERPAFLAVREEGNRLSLE